MLPSTLPMSLGISHSDAGLYTSTGYAYNFAVSGLPWLSAASRENPLARTTAPIRKQQFDNSNEPGEQSIDGWWLRSQQSFHGGAGQLYGDPGTGDPAFSSVRYLDSVGIDPWTPGKVKLLPATAQVSGAVLTKLVNVPGSSGAFGLNITGGLWFIDAANVVVMETSPSFDTTDIAADGLNYYVAGNDGIWKREILAAPFSGWTKIWDLVGTTSPRIACVKQRLVMASNAGVFELASGGPALPPAKWTPPAGVGYWNASEIVEGGGAIYVCSYVGTVLKFSLDSAGVMPTLTSGVVVAQLPSNERIWSAHAYLGRYLALGTDLGARIALINSDGSLELGPLLFTGLRVQAWTSSGKYLYASMFNTAVTTGPADLCRIDLGMEITSLRFAYARDLRVAGGEVNLGNGFGSIRDVTTYKGMDTLLIATHAGVYAQQATYVTSGYLQTSRIRYDTLEPKVYKLLRVRGAQTPADFYVSVIDSLGSESAVIGYVASQIPGLEDADIPDIGPQDYMSVKFTLSSAAGGTISAECSGYQVKALPASPRQRLLRLPLWCFDTEVDRYGNLSGYAGSAATRLGALEDVDRAADVVIFQDLDEGTIDRVVIDEVQFVQTSPPDERFTGPGGVITLTLRTI